MDKENLQLRVYGSNGSLTLRDIATPLFRRRRLMFFTFASLVAGTILGIILFPNNYRAEMKILVKRERVNAAVSPVRDAALANYGDVSEEELNSEVELLKGRDLLERVVVACGLQLSPTFLQRRLFSITASTEPRDGHDLAKKVAIAVSTLEKRLQIEPLKKSNLILVSYDSPDPQLATQVLQVLGSLYLEKTVSVHRSPGAFEFFEAESQHYAKDLRAAESHLTEFDRDKGVIDPRLEQQIAIQKVGEFEATLKSTQIAIKEAEKRSGAVERQLASTPQQTMSQVRTSDNPYLTEQLKTTLLNLELKRTELLEKFEPSYRPVQEIQQQIAQTTEAIAKAEKSPHREETTDRNPSYDWLRSELTRSSAELATLHARAVETRRVIQEYRAQLGVMDANGAAQQDLVREVKEDEGNYLLYVQKREEARIGDALDRQGIVNVAIAEAATIPAMPSHPPWILTLLLGTLLASVASPALAFAVDHFDPSLRTPDELRETLQIPVLAALPREQNR
jgi:uncharacterized protein involved in exopolysaccharide biosynthesis